MLARAWIDHVGWSIPIAAILIIAVIVIVVRWRLRWRRQRDTTDT